MRLITSPIISTEDTDAIIGAENQDGSAFLRLEAALLEDVEILKQEMEADIINAFSWMLYDGIIDMRFAIPCEKLEEGDFHDKFGIFYKGNDALSFSGSINDSKHGFQNYESIKVFKTWAGTQEYVDADTARFEKIWNRKDRNLKMFTIPQAVKNKIFELRSPDRPYSLPAGSSKWVHQDIAVKTFLEKEHGILAMATGTGKTVTAMKIINKLFDSGEIRRVVITMYGNDLLDQWAIQIRENYKNKQINLENFAAGKIDCLLTCKKVSEGIDISSVTNIILFSSDRSRLVTTQRIGRALRLDKNNPEKKATVVDFVIEDSEENDNNADADRAEWLTDLSQTRRCEHEK